jgi:hypothetical protein
LAPSGVQLCESGTLSVGEVKDDIVIKMAGTVFCQEDIRLKNGSY